MRDSWTEVTIGEIATIVPGKYLPKNEYVENGDYFVYGSNSIMGKHSKFLIEPPHTVMAAIGAYAGAVRYSPQPSWVNNNAFGLVVKPAVLPGYLYLWLSSLLDLSTVVAGTGQPYVQRPSLSATKLVLPPVHDQKRIVDMIDSVTAYIAALQQQAAEAWTARNAVLHELLTTGGDDWTETKLGEVAAWHSGGTPKAGKPEFYEDGTIPWVVIADMLETEIFSTASRITPAGLAEIGGKLAPKGSVLISMYATVGRPGFAHIPVATNQAIAWSIPNAEVIHSRFLLFVAQRLEPTISAMARGATQKNINRAILRDCSFMLPPLSEQKRIVETVTAMDDVVSTTEQAVRVAQELRSGLLSALLSGEHEIPATYDRLLGAA